jgi:hypothetical protein
VPRFLLQVRTDEETLDPVPKVLPDISTALAKVHTIARELLADPDDDWLSAWIEVVNEDGNVVGIVQVKDFTLQ